MQTSQIESREWRQLEFLFTSKILHDLEFLVGLWRSQFCLLRVVISVYTGLVATNGPEPEAVG